MLRACGARGQPLPTTLPSFTAEQSGLHPAVALWPESHQCELPPGSGLQVPVGTPMGIQLGIFLAWLRVSTVKGFKLSAKAADGGCLSGDVCMAHDRTACRSDLAGQLQSCHAAPRLLGSAEKHGFSLGTGLR